MQSASNETGSTYDSGFTLIELVVVMVIGGALMAFGSFSFNNWKVMTEERGSADQLQSELRKAAVLSVAEGRTHCVAVDPTTKQLRTWRYRCAATGTPVGAPRGPAIGAQGAHVTFTALAPVPAATTTRPCPTGSTCVYFYPRGTATPAKFEVGSTKRSQTYTINVEGLTSRVYR